MIISEDASFINPLQNVDESRFGESIKYYEKQVIFRDETAPKDPKRRMSPLIDQQERNKLWNDG